MLKALGLQTKVDADTFSKIALRIYQEWLRATLPETSTPGRVSSQRSEIWQTAVEAAHYLRNPSNGLHKADLYQDLALIEFMPAIKVNSCFFELVLYPFQPHKFCVSKM